MICRRAECMCVRLGRKETLDPARAWFLNRDSHSSFVLARWVLKKEWRVEMFWQEDQDEADT